MNKVRDLLNRDVKELNLKLILLSGIVFIAVMGFISYKLTNSSYALFTDNVTGTKTLTFHYDPPRVVTFDPDGGTIPQGTKWTGSGNSATKEVTTGLAYGDLPIPTKEGYTFKGWNGKNLFDEETILMAIDGVRYEDNHYVFTYGKAYDLYGINGKYFPITGIKPNTRYTLTVKGYVEASQCYFAYRYSNGETYYTDGTFRITEEGEMTVTSRSGLNVENVWFTYSSGYPAHISHIQFEEGSTATEYEPYYVTEDTKVTQTSNHTLKAIWEQTQ